MTAEVKYYLDVDDILSVRTECSACHVSTSFPLEKLSRAPHECPHCRRDWVLPHTAEEQAITRFLSSLRGAAEALKGRAFKLSLEVNYENPKRSEIQSKPTIGGGAV